MIDRLAAWFRRQETPPSARGISVAEADIDVNYNDAQIVTHIFTKNVVAARCVLDIARSVASIPVEVPTVTRDGKRGFDEELTRKLRRPNPFESWQTFINGVAIDYLVFGNAFIYKIGSRNAFPQEMWRIPSATLEIALDTRGLPTSYIQRDNRGSVVNRWPVDQRSGVSDILHLRMPSIRTEKGRSLPPIISAYVEANQFLRAGQWNQSLLERGGVLGGVFESERELTQAELNDLRNEIQQAFSGSANAGRYAVLDRLTFKPIGSSPKDMALLELRAFAARLVCQAFGYPPYLLGLPEGATFNNVAEARLALMDNVVLPMAEHFVGEMSRWIWPDGRRAIDLLPDEAPAFEPRMTAKWERVMNAVKAGVLTINEARQELGYDALDSGEVLMLPPTAVPVSSAGDVTEE